MLEGGGGGKGESLFELPDQLPRVEGVTEVDEPWGAIQHCNRSLMMIVNEKLAFYTYCHLPSKLG